MSGARPRSSSLARRRVEAPVFVLTAARSGSTLLRYLLDANPVLVCPPELNLSQLAAEVYRIWEGPGAPPADPGRAARAVAEARRALEAVMADHLARSNKRRFCDKSLTTVDHADLVARTFPEASYVVVYRHCLDVVASAIEACRWGFSAFGVLPYAQAMPHNHVAALVEYWCDRTERALAFERRHPESCYRIYYEALVREPQATLDGLGAFLGAAWPADAIRRAFSSDHEEGPADYEVGFEEGVEARSLGAGSRVPIGLVSPPQRLRCNALLGELGYPPLGEEWNREPSPLLADAEEGDPLVEAILVGRVAPRASRLVELLPSASRVSLRVAVEASPRREQWVVDLDAGLVRRGEAAASAAVVLTARLLVEAALGRWHPGEALHAGELRVAPGGRGVSEEAVVALLRRLLEPEPGEDLGRLGSSLLSLRRAERGARRGPGPLPRPPRPAVPAGGGVAPAGADDGPANPPPSQRSVADGASDGSAKAVPGAAGGR